MLQTLHQQLTFLADLFCDQFSKGTGQENRQSQQEEQAKHFHTGTPLRDKILSSRKVRKTFIFLYHINEEHENTRRN